MSFSFVVVEVAREEKPSRAQARPEKPGSASTFAGDSEVARPEKPGSALVFLSLLQLVCPTQSNQIAHGRVA